MSYIAEIHARQILDSRGNPTVEVDVITDEGTRTCCRTQRRKYRNTRSSGIKGWMIKKYMVEKEF